MSEPNDEKWKPPDEKPLRFVCPRCKRPLARNKADGGPHCVIEDSDQCRYAELLNLRKEAEQLRAKVADQELRQDIARRSHITSTHTFAVLEVTEQTMAEVEGKLRAAEYDHAFTKDDDGRTLVDMHGIALRVVC
jgi:hypothetical protein